MRIIFIIGLMIVCGCVSEPSVYTTKSWEGHYMTVEEFKQKTENIDLEKKESIWVLSNRSMYRLLTTDKERK